MKPWLRGGLIFSVPVLLIAFVLFIILPSFTSETFGLENVIFGFFVSFLLSLIAFIFGSVGGLIIGIDNFNIGFKGFLLGCVIGLLVYSFDYEFFINAGGPNRHINDYLIDIIYRSTGFILEDTFFIMITLFAIGGLLVGGSIQFYKNLK